MYFTVLMCVIYVFYGTDVCCLRCFRYDSLNKLQAAEGEDEGVLQQAPWYQAGIPR